MSPELEMKLCEKYPTLTRGRSEPLTQSLMGFGFECDDGWYGILDHAFGRMVATGEDCKLLQVKEKFGTLRIYTAQWDGEKVEAIIEEAERDSAMTCEVCGDHGKVRGTGWMKTLCEKHRVELGYEDFIPMM